MPVAPGTCPAATACPRVPGDTLVSDGECLLSGAVSPSCSLGPRRDLQGWLWVWGGGDAHTPLQPQQTLHGVCSPAPPQFTPGLTPVPSSLQGGRRGASLGAQGCHPALTRGPGEVAWLFGRTGSSAAWGTVWPPAPHPAPVRTRGFGTSRSRPSSVAVRCRGAADRD